MEESYIYINCIYSMLKKAKIVNLSLNSPKNHAPTIHLIQNTDSNYVHTSTDKKQETLLNHCYRTIKMINDLKNKFPLNENQHQSKTSQFFKISNSIENQLQLNITPEVADSIEVVLRKFIKSKAEEDQLVYGNKISKINIFKRQSGSRLIRRNKQNTDQSTFNNQDKQFQIKNQNGFTYCSVQKIQRRLHELERQIICYKQKIEQQSLLIAKLETKESIMKKKYYDQIIRITRSKNIVSINSEFQKDFQMKGNGKYLLTVNGKTAKDTSNILGYYKKSQQNISSSQSMQTKDNQLNQNSFTKYQQIHQNFNRKDSSKNNKLCQQKIITSNIITPLERQKNINYIEPVVKDQIKEQTKKSVKIAQLKQSLQSLQRQRERVYDELTTVNQSYENKMDMIDQRIIEKLKEIRQQEELLTDQQLKMLKDEDFKVLQINGFYHNQQLQNYVLRHQQT